MTYLAFIQVIVFMSLSAIAFLHDSWLRGLTYA